MIMCFILYWQVKIFDWIEINKNLQKDAPVKQKFPCFSQLKIYIFSMDFCAKHGGSLTYGGP